MSEEQIEEMKQYLMRLARASSIREGSEAWELDIVDMSATNCDAVMGREESVVVDGATESNEVGACPRSLVVGMKLREDSQMYRSGRRFWKVVGFSEHRGMTMLIELGGGIGKRYVPTDIAATFVIDELPRGDRA